MVAKLAVFGLVLGTLGAGARTVEVDAERVRLGHVLPNVASRYAQLDLGAAPELGARRIISRRELRRRLRRAMIPLRGLRLPRRVRVIRPHQTLPQPELAQKVKRAVAGALPSAFAVQSVRVARGLRLARGEVSVRVKPRAGWRQGANTVRVGVAVNGSVQRQMWATANLKRQAPRTRGPMVERGDRVTVRAVVGAVQVRTRGVVQRAGKRGERVPVLPSNARKVVHGIVVAADAVEVRP